jgi:hypothetical protein
MDWWQVCGLWGCESQQDPRVGMTLPTGYNREVSIGELWAGEKERPGSGPDGGPQELWAPVAGMGTQTREHYPRDSLTFWPVLVVMTSPLGRSRAILCFLIICTDTTGITT